MTRLGVIRLLCEALGGYLVSLCFPFTVDFRIRLILLYAIINICCQRYRGKSLLIWDEIKSILITYVCYYFSILLMQSFFGYSWHFFGLITFYVLADMLITFIITRYLHVITWPVMKKNVLIIGVGETASQLYQVCRKNRHSLMDVKGFIDCNNDDFFLHVFQKRQKQKKPVYPLKDLEKIIKKEKIDTVIIAIPEMGRTDIKRLNNRLADQVQTVKFMPATASLVTFDSQIDDFDGFLLISTTKGKMSYTDRILKRTMDIFGGLAGCILLVPLYIYVRHTNHKHGDYGDVFFTQNRIGKDGKEFKMWKFRTMVPGADQILEDLMASDENIRREYEENKKLKNDPRITEAGKFLREKSLDEFPQFLQVLSGKMSLIGPRPYLPREKKDMKEYYDSIIQVKPGVTGMWQTHGRSNTTFDERLELDAYYYRNWNLWLDVVLLIKTVKPMITGKDKGAR